jgi:hypothetical protein
MASVRCRADDDCASATFDKIRRAWKTGGGIKLWEYRMVGYRVVAREIVGKCLVGVQKVLDDDLPIRRRGLRTFPVATPEGALTHDADSGCERFVIGNHTFVGANVLSDSIRNHVINAIIFSDLIGSHVLVVIVLVILIVVLVVDIAVSGH